MPKTKRAVAHVFKPFWRKKTTQAFSNALPSKLVSPTTVFHKGYSWTDPKHGRLAFPELASTSTRLIIPPPSVPVEKKEDDGITVVPKVFKVKKIRVYPTKKQREELKKWFGITRWTYNQCVKYIKKQNYKVSKQELRNKFVNNENFETKNQWVKDIPHNTRDQAMMDTIKAFKAWKAKKKENQTGGFDFKLRKKTDPEQSFAILKKQWGTTRGMLASLFSSKVLVACGKYAPLPTKLPHDSRFLKDKHNHYYICIPCVIQERKENIVHHNKIVAIDPGVRTFLTTYDQDGEVSEWGAGAKTRLYRLALHVDKLKSKCTKVNHKHSYRIRKAIGRIYTRIRNLVDDVRQYGYAKIMKQFYYRNLNPPKWY
jgi:putative transposase